MVYAGPGPFSPEQRLARAMEDSRTAFVSGPLGSGAGNYHDLFGGIREPDPFLVVTPGEGGAPGARMTEGDPSVIADMEELYSTISSPEEQDEAFCESLAGLVETAPDMPVLHERLAGCLQNLGRLEEAREALEAELDINMAHPVANLALAIWTAKEGRDELSMIHVQRAILYQPSWREPRIWLNATDDLPGWDARVQCFAPRISVTIDDEGRVVARAPENQPWLLEYATCKAGFRHAEEVRLAFGMKAGPYKRSLLEEMVRLRIDADTYAEGRDADAPEEVIGEILIDAATSERLLEAALFEVVTWHDPDFAKLLPADLTALVEQWIRDTVLVKEP